MSVERIERLEQAIEAAMGQPVSEDEQSDQLVALMSAAARRVIAGLDLGPTCLHAVAREGLDAMHEKALDAAHERDFERMLAAFAND